MEGTIFDIQRFSVHDGPGIRTTVFMKGCPLSCLWCHNPEGLSNKIQLQYFKNDCIGCKRCGNQPALADAVRCPAEALKVCGKIITDAELLDELLKDGMFYSNGGGVTFSGGECLMQADFVAHMLRLLKENGISTVVDTSGCADFKEFEKLLDGCDLFLYDIKMTDSAKHKLFTGADNRIILENAKLLSETGKPIWIRTPIIPDVNDTEDEITKIADFIAGLKSVEQATLMPYHTLGKSKYETLGLECRYNTDKQLSREQLELFKRIFTQKNIKIGG